MDKVEQSQKEIIEVVNIMKVNCEKILERGEKINSLQQRADLLTINGTNFSKTSKDLRRREMIRYNKMIAGVFLFMSLIFFSFGVYFLYVY